ncbi:hypothetical protein [Ulvibacterium sp.]|uniref:hypothetical protein n=1 Tax=Ulvibacterium sp. TaxID=2665914 RepID=UPI003BAC12EA
MKNHHILALAILIFLGIILWVKPEFLQDSKVQEKTVNPLDIEKKQAVLEQKDYVRFDEAKVELGKYLDGLVGDNPTTQIEAEKQTVIDMVDQNYQTINKEKRDSLLEYFKENLENKVALDNLTNTQKKTNYTLIIAIVLLAGLLGGYARRYYPELKDVIKLAQEADQKAESLKSKATDMKRNAEIFSRSYSSSTTIKSSFENEIKTLENETNSIDIEAQNIKSEVNHLLKTVQDLSEHSSDTSVLANLLFGIIASSLSFLALSATESKVLDFQSGTDYLILWGWCSLFAIFARNIIESIVNMIKKKLPS